MKRQLTNIVFIVVLFIGCSDNSSNDAHNHSTMNTNVDTGMGDMPGMNHDTTTDNGIENVLAPTNRVVLSSAETIHPEIKTITDRVNLSGYVGYDERRNNIVSVRTSGRIEKLYVKINYQFIHKGDKILELYSPELNTYIDEYKHHLNTKSDSNLIGGTRQKLKFMGITDNQIQDIENGKKITDNITIYSSYDGIIVYDFDKQKNILAGNNSPGSSGMSGMSEGSSNQSSMSSNAGASGGRLREGDYVSKGQTLLVVNDCKVVYGLFSVSPNDVKDLKTNLPIKIQSSSMPGEEINAAINFIEPVYSKGHKFIQARVYIDNPTLRLKVYSILQGAVSTSSQYLAVPSSSILSAGNRNFVWVVKSNDKKQMKSMEATEVFPGKETNGFTQIISGISEQDEIARDAGYLLDSESLINQGKK